MSLWTIFSKILLRVLFFWSHLFIFHCSVSIRFIVLSLGVDIISHYRTYVLFKVKVSGALIKWSEKNALMYH